MTKPIDLCHGKFIAVGASSASVARLIPGALAALLPSIALAASSVAAPASTPPAPPAATASATAVAPGSVRDDVLAPVVVTAAAPSSASPLVSTFDPHQARQPIPASDGADYLKTIPGFEAVRNGGTNGDPVLRGMFGSRLTMLSNGTSMSGACPGRMDAPTSYLSPETFDKVTVIKGPETVLWGPIGSAGTVLFERKTKRFDAPGMRFHGALVGGSGGRNDQLADMAAGGPSGDIRVIAQHAHADDYRDGRGTIVPSRWDKWNLDTTLGWNLDGRTRLELDAGTGDGDARYAGRNMDGTRFRRNSAALRFTQQHRDGLIETITAQIYANQVDHLMDNYSLRQPTAMGGMSMSAAAVHGKPHGMPMSMASNVERLIVGGRGALRFRFSPAWYIDAGMDAESQRHRARSAMARGNRGVDYRPAPWHRDADSLRLGTFSELHGDLTARDRLIAGLRLDRYSVHDLRPGATASMPMPMPMPMWVPTQRTAWLPGGFIRLEHDLIDPSVTVYAGVGHASRFPDYWELFSAGAGPLGSANAFNGVRPERTTQLDIGARYDNAGRSAWISAYTGRVSDFILFDYRGAGAMASSAQTRARNINARIFGGELGAALPLGAHWQAEASLASAFGNNVSDGTPLTQIPPVDARLSLRYKRGRAAAGVLWRGVAAQHRYALNQGNVAGQDFGPSGGFSVWSMNTSYALTKRVSLSAGIDNLFNKVYAEHLNKAGSAGFGYPADTLFDDPGRTGWVKLTIDLG